MLLQAGGLALRAGGRLALSPAGVKALSMPPAEVLRGLWRKWVKTTLFDEFSRIDAIKGQNSKARVMTAVASRRAAIEEALRACPVGRWIAIDDFSRFMQASDRVFEVTHDPWKLYVGERQYGSLGYDGSDGWNILQERYISAVLFEYAATLGMVDVAYVDPAGARDDYRDMWGTDELAFLSRYDGMSEFRLTPLGAYVLGLDAAYKPVAIPSNVALSVLPSLQVNVVRGALGAEEVLLLENWAVPVQAGSWRLDREKALSAIEKGYDIAELRGFLESRDDMPLPESVESFIRQCERNGKALKTVGSAVLIECRDNETAEAIAGHKETAPYACAPGQKRWLFAPTTWTSFARGFACSASVWRPDSRSMPVPGFWPGPDDQQANFAAPRVTVRGRKCEFAAQPVSGRSRQKLRISKGSFRRTCGTAAGGPTAVIRGAKMPA